MQDKIITRQMIIDEARTWLKVRWRHQGRTKYGIDCAGLVILVGHGLSLSEFDTTNYSRHGFQQEFVKMFREHMDEKPVTQRKPGDVLLFRDNTYPCHAAILTMKAGVEYIIHTSPKRRGTAEEPLNQVTDKVTHCFAYRGVQD